MRVGSKEVFSSLSVVVILRLSLLTLSILIEEDSSEWICSSVKSCGTSQMTACLFIRWAGAEALRLDSVSLELLRNRFAEARSAKVIVVFWEHEEAMEMILEPWQRGA